MVEPLVGNERVEGGQIEAKQRYKFTLRHNSNLTTDDRLNYDSKNFRILSIQKKFEIDKYAVVIAEEGVEGLQKFLKQKLLIVLLFEMICKCRSRATGKADQRTDYTKHH